MQLLLLIKRGILYCAVKMHYYLKTKKLKKMKKFRYIKILILVIIYSNSFAQTAQNGKVLITGTRFTYPLVEKWISEFKIKYPDVEVKILPRGLVTPDSGNIVINAHKLLPNEVKQGYTTINISKYALLPVANANNPLINEYAKGLREKDIKDLFFEKDIFESTGKEKKKKNKFQPTIYTREQKACAPTTFASHYGFTQDNIIGKGVSGDDKHLINAILKDSSGLTYNVPVFIYDLTSRKVKPGIKVIPLDLNENGKLDADENIYENLDELIAGLESEKHTAIPVEYVNISYPKVINSDNNNLKLFINYILNEGQQFNHQFGFIDFDQKTLAKQKDILKTAAGN